MLKSDMGSFSQGNKNWFEVETVRNKFEAKIKMKK